MRAVALVEEVDALERLPRRGVAERDAARARRAGRQQRQAVADVALREAPRRAEPVDAQRQRRDPRVLDQEAAAVQARVGVGLKVARERRERVGELLLRSGGAADREVERDLVDAARAGQPQFGVELGGLAFLLIGLLGDQLAVALAATQIGPQPLMPQPLRAALRATDRSPSRGPTSRHGGGTSISPSSHHTLVSAGAPDRCITASSSPPSWCVIQSRPTCSSRAGADRLDQRLAVRERDSRVGRVEHLRQRGEGSRGAGSLPGRTGRASAASAAAPSSAATRQPAPASSLATVSAKRSESPAARSCARRVSVRSRARRARSR